MKSWYNFFKFLFYIGFKIFNRLEVFSAEKVPEKGGVIVAANHSSYLDPPLIGVALKRRATFMAKEGLFKVPLLGRFVRAFSFPVRRGRPQPSTIKEAVRRLKEGQLIVMFPEGGRRSGGEINDVKRGVELLARMSGASVVPALIEGTDRALPVGAWFIRPAKVIVKFGDPITVNSNDEDITRAVIDAMKRLKSDSRGKA
jgi:1-acyl-sn-glycerol-3-phosphate acyltransferase